MYLDIICIGFGISGLYLGYHGMKSNKNVLFVEQSDRIGEHIQNIKLNNEE